MENFGIFRPKSKEEIQEQVKKTEGILGTNILPEPEKNIDEIDIKNIQEKYKTRYDAYLATLRAERRGQLGTKEIDHAKMWIKGLNNLDAYIKDHESQDDPLLREKQYIVYKKIRDFLEEGKRKGYVKLPTGTGKTILFLKIAEALDMKTFVASPSKVILGQNAEETEEFTESEFGKYYGQEKDSGKKVTHITYHSLLNVIKDGIVNPDDIPVLILDEGHRSLGPERSQAISKFEGLQLAFTATSEFSEEKKLSDIYEEIYRMDIDEAIREGLACQTQTIHAYTNIDLSNVEIKSGEYNQAQLEKALNVTGRNMAALELYKNKFDGLKAICNCSGVNHAQEVARLFNENGIRAACITEGTKQDEREEIFKAYKAGTIKILTNAQVLLEGFNEKSCSVTFNLHPTLSLVDAEQRARSGRLDDKNPEKWSYVVDFIDQNSKKPQVLYSEILKSDRVWDITKEEKKSESKDTESKNRAPKPPIDFGNLSIDGLRVIVDTKTIMEITNINLAQRKEKIEDAPAGWLSAHILKKEIGRFIEIKKTAEKYKKTNPEWFKFYISGPTASEHFHPDLVSKIKEELLVTEAPPGWLFARELMSDLKNDASVIKRRAEKYRKEHPEWFKKFKIKGLGQVSEYFHPDLIQKLREDYEKITPPEGWLPMDVLWRKKIVKSHYTTIKNVAEKYRENHPDWFKIYNSGYKFSEHYSPELIAKIKEELSDMEAPDGWVTMSILTKKFGDKIAKEIEQYRATNPDWFKNFKKKGSLREFYSPELVEQLKTDLRK